MKYEKIKHRYFDEKYISLDTARFYIRTIIKLINTFKIGYELSGKNSSFLEIPILELGGNGMIQWYTFDDDGMLKAIKGALEVGFMAFEELKYLISIREKQNKDSEVFFKIRDQTYKKLLQETEISYNKLSFKAEKYGVFDDERKVVANCIRNWWILYQVSKDLKMFDKCLNELSGSGIFLWFEATELNMILNDKSNQILYVVNKIRETLPKLKSTIEQEYFYKSISTNLLEKDIIPRYNERYEGIRQERIAIFQILLEVKNIYKNIFSHSDLLNLLFEELINENKLQWFDINEDGVSIYWEAYIEEIDYAEKILDLLELLFDELSGKTNIKKSVATNRCIAKIQEYKREVNEFRPRNGNVEMRITLDMVRKCRYCFGISPNIRFLDEAIKEVEGKGRIRWYRRLFKWRGFYFEIATWKSLEYYNEYAKERKEVLELLRKMEHHEIDYYDEPIDGLPINPRIGRLLN